MYIYGDLELQGHFDIFSLVKTEVVRGRVQQPVLYLIGPWDDCMVHGVNNPLVLRTSTFSLTCALIIVIIGNHVLVYTKPRPWNMEPYSNHAQKAITKIRPSLIEIMVPYGFLVANRWVKEAHEVTWLPQQKEEVVAEIRNVSLFRSYRIPNWIGLTDLILHRMTWMEGCVLECHPIDKVGPISSHRSSPF